MTPNANDVYARRASVAPVAKRTERTLHLDPTLDAAIARVAERNALSVDEVIAQTLWASPLLRSEVRRT